MRAFYFMRRICMLGMVGIFALAGCGGGGGGGSGPTSSGGSTGGGGAGVSSKVPYSAGVFQPYKSLANQCSTAAAQNNFLRSWINDTYLWYGEVPDTDPNSYQDTLDYFDVLKTAATTTSGNSKDRFHFTYDTDEWVAFSQSGVSAGFGVQWISLGSYPPRDLRVAYVDPNTPAAAAGLQRGDMIVSIDGADAINGSTDAIIDKLVAGLDPQLNEAHQYTMRPVSGSDYTVTMVATNFTSTPVQNVKVLDAGGKKVGYVQFNDHIAIAEPQLISAINQLKTAGVTELVLDIRYNGGGALYIASELAYMIAGPGVTNGKAFEKLIFNDKYPTTNPITGAVQQPTPFFSTDDNNVALPSLNLGRIFVLTGAGTCSASESVINGLRGIGVDVVQIGGGTCGKPYGFYPQDNCGTTYFAIQFEGVNEQDFGDYGDGFLPSNATIPGSARIPGCSVADDFKHQLGDPAESRVAAALSYASTATCPTPPLGSVQKPTLSRTSAEDGILLKSPLREMRVLGGRLQ